jgi:hypothetical protein
MYSAMLKPSLEVAMLRAVLLIVAADAACCSVDRRRSGGNGILYSSEHSHSPGDSGQVPADGNTESPGAKARL